MTFENDEHFVFQSNKKVILRLNLEIIPIFFKIGLEHSVFCSPSLDRNAQYLKTMAVSRLPGYITIQMVRWENHSILPLSFA